MFDFGKAAMYDLPRANDDFAIGEARIIREGKDVAFIATGETVIHALLAAERLKSNRRVGSCRQHAFHQAARR